ncbi:biopolymer transporter ExbD [bacterium SCSIO 12696]|nr:biopolymer transporter ExbD [bacterium SCSIO 12696]
MALGKRRKAEDESEIDLTPMLDVVFIMLIFFIVTASFVKESGIDLNKPPSNDSPPPEDDNKPKNVVFEVTADGQILLKKRLVDIRSVRANIERMKAENPEAKVIVQAHPQAPSKVFIGIADQAREAEVAHGDITLSFKEE